VTSSLLSLLTLRCGWVCADVRVTGGRRLANVGQTGKRERYHGDFISGEDQQPAGAVVVFSAHAAIAARAAARTKRRRDGHLARGDPPAVWRGL
jgi:hypothetical protein